MFFDQGEHNADLGHLALAQFAVGVVLEQEGQIFRHVELHARAQPLP